MPTPLKLRRRQRVEEARAGVAAAQQDLYAPAREEIAGMAAEIQRLIASDSGSWARPTLRSSWVRKFAELEEKEPRQRVERRGRDGGFRAPQRHLYNGQPLAAALAAQMSCAGRIARYRRGERDDDGGGSSDRALSRQRQVFTGGGGGDTAARMIEGTKEWAAEQERLNGLTAEQLDLELDTARIRREAASDEVSLPKRQRDGLRLQRNAAEATRSAAAKAAKGGGGGGGGASDAEREREAVRKLIEQLEFEAVADRHDALEQREDERAAPGRGGSDRRADGRRSRHRSRRRYAELEAHQGGRGPDGALKGVSQDVLGGMFEDMRDGVQAADLLANALNRVMDAFVQAGIERLIEGAFPRLARRRQTPAACSAGASSRASLMAAALQGKAASTGPRLSGGDAGPMRRGSTTAARCRRCCCPANGC